LTRSEPGGQFLEKRQGSPVGWHFTDGGRESREIKKKKRKIGVLAIIWTNSWENYARKQKSPFGHFKIYTRVKTSNVGKERKKKQSCLKVRKSKKEKLCPAIDTGFFNGNEFGGTGQLLWVLRRGEERKGDHARKNRGFQREGTEKVFNFPRANREKLRKKIQKCATEEKGR